MSLRDRRVCLGGWTPPFWASPKPSNIAAERAQPGGSARGLGVPAARFYSMAVASQGVRGRRVESNKIMGKTPAFCGRPTECLKSSYSIRSPFRQLEMVLSPAKAIKLRSNAHSPKVSWHEKSPHTRENTSKTRDFKSIYEHLPT